MQPGGFIHPDDQAGWHGDLRPKERWRVIQPSRPLAGMIKVDGTRLKA